MKWGGGVNKRVNFRDFSDSAKPMGISEKPQTKKSGCQHMTTEHDSCWCQPGGRVHVVSGELFSPNYFICLLCTLFLEHSFIIDNFPKRFPLFWSSVTFIPDMSKCMEILLTWDMFTQSFSNMSSPNHLLILCSCFFLV